MTLNEYQKIALTTAGEKCFNMNNVGLGLAGEAGKAADAIKKHLYQYQDLDEQKFAEKLGDILWYIALGSSMLGYNLESIAKMNANKIAKLYPKGANKKAVANCMNGEDKKPESVIDFVLGLNQRTTPRPNGFDPFPRGSIYYSAIFNACKPSLKVVKLDEETGRIDAEINLIDWSAPSLQLLNQTIPPYQEAEKNIEDVKTLAHRFYEERMSAFDGTIIGATDKYVKFKAQNPDEAESISEFESNLNHMLNLFICANFGNQDQFAVVLASTLSAWYGDLQKTAIPQ